MKVIKRDDTVNIHLELGDKGYVNVSHGIQENSRYGSIYISFPMEVFREIAKEVEKK